MGPTSKYEQLQVAQVADLNPGIRAGLFWTIPVSDDAVAVDLAKGTASLRLDHVGVYDFTDLGAALTSPEVGQPSVASLRSDHTTDQVTPNLGAPDPLGASPAAYGIIGREKNGVFFPA